MLVFLYILNSLLAVMFLVAGANKALRPKSALQEMGMDWVENMPASAVKLIGLLEVVGALGLILPLLLSVAPILTPFAAIGLAIVMAGAIVLHARRNETFGMQAVLTALSLVSAIIGFLVVTG